MLRFHTHGGPIVFTGQTHQDLPAALEEVANGPATVHSEYLLLADIHIASECATYGDLTHPSFGITGGDGPHVVWVQIDATARAKWLLWTTTPG